MITFKKIFFFCCILILLALLALAARQWQRPREECVLDGTPVLPITRVEVVSAQGEKLVFCSVCCAHAWLKQHPELAHGLAKGQGSIVVVDEVSGLLLDAGLAYWIESDQPSRRENRCMVHVFKEKEAAARHLLDHHGRELVGYLAGLGRQLSWAQNFSAPDLRGRLHGLQDFRGKIVFLRFWNSGNPFFHKDLTQLQQAYDRFHERGFIVIAVNVEESPASVKKALKNLQITYPVLLDTQGRIADSYGVSGYPTGYLIDRAGIVEKSVVGEITADLMQPLIYPLW